MIGNNGNGKAPWRIALEDSVVVMGAAFLSALIATGLKYPPSADVVYAAAIPSVLVGLVSWAKARNVPLVLPAKP